MKVNEIFSIGPVAVQDNKTISIAEIEKGIPYNIKFVVYNGTSADLDLSEQLLFDTIEEAEEHCDDNVFYEELMERIYDHLDVKPSIENYIDDEMSMTLSGWTLETLKKKSKPLNKALQREMSSDEEPWYKKGHQLYNQIADMEDKDGFIQALTSYGSMSELYGEGEPLTYTDLSHLFWIEMLKDETGNLIYKVKDQTMGNATSKTYKTIPDLLEDYGFPF